MIAHLSQTVAARTEEVFSVEEIGARGRHIEAADEIHQRCLTRAGRSHNGKIVALLHFQTDILQHANRLFALRVVLAEVLHLNQHLSFLR